METIDSLRIYVARRGDLPLVLVPDADNIPTVVEPAPTLIRAEYILQDEATDDRLFQAAQRLEQTGMLLLMQPGVDGPNSRTAFVYPQPEDWLKLCSATNLKGQNQIWTACSRNLGSGWMIKRWRVF